MTGPLKWHGGKHYLAPKIVALMPPRCQTPNSPAATDPGWLHYVEPFAGGLSVLLAIDPTGISEVVTDRNRHLTNFWNVLKRPHTFEALNRIIAITPFSQIEYKTAADIVRDLGWTGIPIGGDIPMASTAGNVLRACAFFVACRQSLAGRMNGFATLSRNRTRRGMNEQAAAWLSAVDGLPEIHERLKRVVILNDDAIGVIRQQDGPRTLFYLDPPYLHETRATTGEYEHEMTAEQHNDLLDLLGNIKGRFLLSGYPSALYEQAARFFQWKRHDFEISNHASGAETKRIMTECLWVNY
jgi:DNA adenine methylase